MTQFFTSDTHYYHSNVIEYCKRPFKDADEMNEALIAAHNSVVKPNDEVFHLGDFAFCSADKIKTLLSRLNGKIHLILGNHDRTIQKNLELQKCFDSVTHGIKELKIDGQTIVLCHYPMLSWNKMHHGSIMLHGHCHGTMKYPFTSRIYDVGVDANSDFSPVKWTKIKGIMDKITTTSSLDHHT